MHHFISLHPPTRHARDAQDAPSERDNRETETTVTKKSRNAAKGTIRHTRVCWLESEGEKRAYYKCTYTPVCLVTGPRRGSRGVEAQEYAMAGLGVHKAGKDTRYQRDTKERDKTEDSCTHMQGGRSIQAWCNIHHMTHHSNACMSVYKYA